MIDINEIRIGNYVMAENAHYSDLEIKKVFAIQKKDESVSLEGLGICIKNEKFEKCKFINHNPPIFNSNPYVCSLITPISLSMDLLLRCHFKEINQEKTMISSDGKIELQVNDEGVKDPESNNIIRFLHQLQNLYFSRTGKQLDVDLSIKE